MTTSAPSSYPYRCSSDNALFVQFIMPHKEYLFAKFSAHVTHEGKRRRWLHIRNQLVEAGATAQFADKDEAYMRQRWSDMKRRTMEKLERAAKRPDGTIKLTEADKLIVQIIGDNATQNGQQPHNDEYGTANEDGPTTSNNSADFSNEVMEEEWNVEDDLKPPPMILYDQPTNLALANVPQIPLSTTSAKMGSVAENQNCPKSTKRPYINERISGKVARNTDQQHQQHHQRVLNEQLDHDDVHQQSVSTSGPMNNADEFDGAISTDLDGRLKRAKLVYYRSQTELNRSLKSESIVRRRLLELQIEKLQREMDDEEL